MKLGVHPRKRNLNPSFFTASLTIAIAPPGSFSFAFMILVLQTSIGEHLDVRNLPSWKWVHCSSNESGHETRSEMSTKIILH